MRGGYGLGEWKRLALAGGGGDGKVPVHFMCCKVGLLILLGPLIFVSGMLLITNGGAGRSLSLWSMIMDRNQVRGYGISGVVSEAAEGGSGGEDGSCLSRSHHLDYRPTSHDIPNAPRWKEAFRVYETMHMRCALNRNWTDTFLNPPERDPCRYLIYDEGPAGLGNRLLSLASAFMFALLTDRVLLVDASPKAHLAVLLCEPFQYSSWLLPKNFPYDVVKTAVTLGPAFEQQFQNISHGIIRLRLQHDQNWGDQRFFCSRTREDLKSVPWLIWSSNQYYVPVFATIPEFWPKIVHLFPKVSLAFTYLSRQLLLPQNYVWQRIHRVHSSYLACSNRIITVQIRRHSVQNGGEYHQPTFNRVMQCLWGNKLLTNPTNGEVSTGMSLQVGLESNKSIKNRREKEQACERVTAVFFASLQSRYYEEMKNLYTNLDTVDGSLVRAHMVSHDGAEWHTFDQAVKAFTEMWLLSYGDYIATSSWSTFGYIAQGLAGLQPYLMNIKGDFEKDGLPPCSIGQSSDPCNMNPSYPDCIKESPLSAEHSDWIKRHLKSCKDEPHGIQFVDIEPELANNQTSSG